VPEDIKASDLVRLVSSLLKYTAEEKKALTFQFVTASDLSKRCGGLANYQKGELLLTPLFHKKRDTYLVADLDRKMPIEFTIELKARLEHLARSGAAVLLLTGQEVPDGRQSLENPLLTRESLHWAEVIDTERQNLELKKNKKRRVIPAT
ncbi:MAG: hypothetical protein GY940_46795, partial [bacterium]|nr:hypothetical protein [bacterium]